MPHTWRTMVNARLIADVLRDLVLETPPNVTEGSWLEALPELLRTARLGSRMRG